MLILYNFSTLYNYSLYQCSWLIRRAYSLTSHTCLYTCIRTCIPQIFADSTSNQHSLWAPLAYSISCAACWHKVLYNHNIIVQTQYYSAHNCMCFIVESILKLCTSVTTIFIITQCHYSTWYRYWTLADCVILSVHLWLNCYVYTCRLGNILPLENFCFSTFEPDLLSSTTSSYIYFTPNNSKGRFLQQVHIMNMQV